MTITLHQLMSNKIIIIDFEDSFTYNIANILFPYEKKMVVVPHQQFFHAMIKSLLVSTERHAVILGPGPGHPDQYKKYFHHIITLMNAPNIYMMGICLGHQLMGKILGHRIDQLEWPVHGQAIECKFKDKKFLVQRYNSLGVFVNNKVKDIIYYPRGISYQFHPESVGTNENEIFFEELLTFLE